LYHFCCNGSVAVNGDNRRGLVFDVICRTKAGVAMLKKKKKKEKHHKHHEADHTRLVPL
jgi:hypothetical protein